jgi:hypothetical protein
LSYHTPLLSSLVNYTWYVTRHRRDATLMPIHSKNFEYGKERFSPSIIHFEVK